MGCCLGTDSALLIMIEPLLPRFSLSRPISCVHRQGTSESISHFLISSDAYKTKCPATLVQPNAQLSICDTERFTVVAQDNCSRIFIKILRLGSNIRTIHSNWNRGEFYKGIYANRWKR